MKYSFSFVFLLSLNSIFGMQNSDQSQKLTIEEIKLITKDEEVARIRFLQEAERVKAKVGPEAFMLLEQAWTDYDIEQIQGYKMTYKTMDKITEYTGRNFKALISPEEAKTIIADKEIVLDLPEFFACIFYFCIKRLPYYKTEIDNFNSPMDYPKLTEEEMQPFIHPRQVFKRLRQEGQRVRAQLGEENFQRLANVWTENYVEQAKEMYSTFSLEELENGINFSSSNLNGILSMEEVTTIFPDKQITMDFLEFLGFSTELKLMAMRKKYNQDEN